MSHELKYAHFWRNGDVPPYLRFDRKGREESPESSEYSFNGTDLIIIEHSLLGSVSLADLWIVRR